MPLCFPGLIARLLVREMRWQSFVEHSSLKTSHRPLLRSPPWPWWVFDEIVERWREEQFGRQEESYDFCAPKFSLWTESEEQPSGGGEEACIFSSLAHSLLLVTRVTNHWLWCFVSRHRCNNKLKRERDKNYKLAMVTMATEWTKW